MAPCLPQPLPHTHPVLSGRCPSSCLLLLGWHHWMREAGKATYWPASTSASWLHPSLRRPPRVVPEVLARPHPTGSGSQIFGKAPGPSSGLSPGLRRRARAAARKEAHRREAGVDTARTHGFRQPRCSARGWPHAPLRKRRPVLGSPACRHPAKQQLPAKAAKGGPVSAGDTARPRCPQPPQGRRRRLRGPADSAGGLGAPGDPPSRLPPAAVMDPVAWRGARARAAGAGS